MSAPAATAAAEVVRTRRSPYQGLVPFSESEAEWFFGREEWSAVIADNLRAYRVTVLYGASGVGKSSLLRAGMIRMLRDEARENVADLGLPRLLPVGFSDWSLDDPLSALKDAVREAAREVAPELADQPPDGSLAEVLEAWPARVEGTLLLVLDQLEELFVYHERAGDTTLDELAALLRRRDAGVHFLLSIREDALARLDRFEGQVSGLGDHLLRLEHLDRDAAREAIVEPLERWNRTVDESGADVEIEPALVEAVLDQVTAGRVALGETSAASAGEDRDRAAGIEAPYLQLVLIRLWDEERTVGSRLMRLQTLERLGGAERIVRTHLDTALAALSTQEQDVAARTFRFLVTPSGTKIALRIADLAEYAEVPPEQLGPLVERLSGEVRVLRPAGDGRSEIYHDALAGPILDWRERWEERQRRRRERRRLLVVTVIFATLLAVIAGVSFLAVWALDQRRSARRAASVAEKARASEVAEVAVRLANIQQESRPDVSLLVGLAAYRMKPSAEALASLVTTLNHIKQSGLVAIMRTTCTYFCRVAVSPDGRTFATGETGVVSLWDARTHRRLGHPLTGHLGSVVGVAFSPEGRIVAGAGADGAVLLWNTHTGREVGTPLGGQLEPVFGVGFSPNGRLLATAGADATVRLWSTRGHGQVGQLKGHTNSVDAVAFSPDGNLLASASEDETVRLWDAHTQREVGRPLRGHSASVVDVAFSPSGRTLASAGFDGTVRLWDVRTHRQLGSPLHGDAGAVESVAFSRDGRLLAGGTVAGTVLLWDVRTHQQLGPPLRGHTSAVTGLAFTPSGTLVSASADGTLRLWNPSGQQLYGRPFQGHRNIVVVFSPDGRMLATGGVDGTLQLWDTKTDRPLGRPLTGHTDLIEQIAFSPDGRVLASASDDKTLRLWDARSHGQLGQPLRGHTGAVTGVAFSPNGHLLASASDDGTVRLWDVRSHRQVGHPLLGHTGAVNGVAFSPDGHLLASTGDDGTVRLWDVRSHRQLGQPLVGHTEQVGRVAFSPDGRTLASAGADGTIRLWEVRAHREIGEPLRGHTGFVIGLAFSPDGRTIASTGYDGTVRLWDARTHAPLLQPLRGHAGAVMYAAFSPDGRTLATAGIDGTIRLWEAFPFGGNEGTLAYLQARACRFTGGNLTRDEWAEFAPGIPYRKSCP